tara:strand:+ start:5285 stop:6523 length:1239 start_codon:yes stop_codon:yes gene_type:complete
MQRHKYTDFVDILDNYNNKSSFSQQDKRNLDYIINNNYYNKECSILSENTIAPYQVTDNSSTIIHDFTSYEKWQNENETNVNVDADSTILVPKKKKCIEIRVNTLDDLVKIIETNQHEDDTEYNIDLKMLHNIHNELNELNNMIGMSSIKESILYQILYFIQKLHINGTSHDYKHTVIYGPPGTGKTEVAKIIGKMYSKMGILKKNIFKKVTRNDLVAGYLGQTAIKTKAVIDECKDGVLFIDEAYSLATGDKQDSFSKECVDTLCESLSDNKDNLMVIIAGYENEINEKLFTMNQGLSSRFIWRFTTDKYTSKELSQIFVKKLKLCEWKHEIEEAVLEKWFKTNTKEFEYFGRDIELLVTYVKITHGKRVYGNSNETKKQITIEDLNDGLALLIRNKKVKETTPAIFGLYT